MKNRRFFRALLLIIALVGTFYTGMRTQAYLYKDPCLDLDGDKDLGNYPICMPDKNATDERLK